MGALQVSLKFVVMKGRSTRDVLICWYSLPGVSDSKMLYKFT
jgi:hypothetical protein